MKKVYFLFICTLLLSFISCDFGIEEIPRQRELVDISLDTTKVKLDYAKNTPKLSTIDLKIYGHYSDGTTEEIDVADAKFTGFKSDEIGTVTIDVEYNGFHKQYDINIGEDLPDHLEIVNYPEQLFYWLEDLTSSKSINLNGLQVNLHYRSGKKTEINDLTKLEIRKTEQGKFSCNTQKYNITITYKEISESFYIYGITREIIGDNYFFRNQSITDFLRFKIISNPKINTYKLNEKINLEDAEIQVINQINNDLLVPKLDCTKCHLVEDIVTENVCNTNKAQININGIYIDFTLTITDKFITGASLNINNSEFIQNNCKGQELNFTNNKIFEFKRIYDGSKEESIFFTNEGNIESFYDEKLKYSVNNVVDFKNANAINKSLVLDKNIKIGENTIYFYYQFYSQKNNSIETKTFTKNIYIQDAKLDYLEAKVSYNDNNKKYIPKDTSINNILKYINVQLTGKKTDGSNFEFPFYSNKISYKIINQSDMDKHDFSKGDFTAKVEVIYSVSNDTKIKTKVPFEVIFKEESVS